MNLPVQLKVKPSFWGRLFGSSNRTLIANEAKELLLVDAQGQQEELLDEVIVRVSGVFYDTLRIKSKKQVISISWISKDLAKQAVSLSKNIHQIRHSEEVILAADQLLAILDQASYIREKTWLKCCAKALSFEKLINGNFDRKAIGEDHWAAIHFLRDLAAKEKAVIREKRKLYIAKQYKAFATFFDKVESNPLTENQRKSCIINEENNLILAGAGTGKTSVMIARAGYLLKSGLAQKTDILMLAYANKAAEEMSQRVSDKLNGIKIDVSTFHSLGQKIVSQVEGGKPSLSVFATDEKLRLQFIQKNFNELLNDKSYRDIVVQYFNNYLFEDIDPFAYETLGDHLDALKANEIRTLKGEQVKSYQECLIANFFFLNGVEYAYEAKYKYPTKTVDHRQYQPDFYLPQYDIYLEHYGVDRKGFPATYINPVEYQQSMQWKRQLHETKKTVCLETFHYQHKEGNLLESLKALLSSHEVRFKPLSQEEILTLHRENGTISMLEKLLNQMLKLYKSGNFSEYQLQEKAQEMDNPERFLSAIKLLTPLHKRYENYLQEKDDIDFDDMINKAIQYVRSGQYRSQWKHIMIDEFQDISSPRAQLIKELRQQVEDSTLFCVGDDWQAIYRFSGSDLNFTTEFKKTFGFTATTLLDKTFRFNNSICDVASSFVSRNPEQLQKRLSTHDTVNQPAVSILKAPNAADGDLKSLHKILSAISQRTKKKASVFILERFSFNLPSRSELQGLQREFTSLQLSPMTIHASKGKEADFVVLPTMGAGKYGFPSEKITHPLLDALLPRSQEFKQAEERRLFYVALTRARQRVYLITDMMSPSAFIEEFLKEKYPIALNEFLTPKNQRFFEALYCIVCETGKLVSRISNFGSFWGCSHFPMCKHTEKGCTTCESPMLRKEQYKVCADEQCKNWVLTCSSCNADMVKRTNRSNGSVFWGCSNYSRKDEFRCKHTTPYQELSLI